MHKRSSSMLMTMITVSFLGFCIENIWIAATQGVINNRNMLLPFLWGYGLAIFVIYLLFGTPEAPKLFTKELNIRSSALSTVYYFIIAFLCVCIGEIILGYAIEWGCDIIWWDYSCIPMHITRYTSVPTSAAFATLITVFMKFMLKPMLNLFDKANPNVIGVLAISLAILLSLDMLNSLIYMIQNNDTMHVWSITIGDPILKIHA